MAEEIRIIRGDTYDLEFRILDGDTGEPVTITGEWNVGLSSDTINKNSVSNPSDFDIETGDYTTGEGAVHLASIETNPTDQRPWCNPRRSHYKLFLYKDDNPAIVKTVSSGDFLFISEA